MKKTILSIALIAISFGAYAGSSLETECDIYGGDFHEGKTVQAINVVTMDHAIKGTDNGYAVNVKSDNIWGLASLRDGNHDYSTINRNTIVSLARTAYLTQSKVNVCFDKGWLVGIELAEKK